MSSINSRKFKVRSLLQMGGAPQRTEPEPEPPQQQQPPVEDDISKDKKKYFK